MHEVEKSKQCQFLIAGDERGSRLWAGGFDGFPKLKKHVGYHILINDIIHLLGEKIEIS